MPKKSYTIDRKKWLRGELTLNGGSYLLRSADGLMCCLGQMIEQAGANRRTLKGRAEPEDVARCHFDNKLRKLLIDPEKQRTSQLALSAMRINDEEGFDDGEREQFLVDLFATAGIKLRFIN